MESADEPESEPAAKSVVEPVVESVVESVVEPVVEPVVESAAVPVVEPVAEPVNEPVVESSVEPVEPVAEPAEPVVESVTEPATEPISAPVAENVEPVVQNENGFARLDLHDRVLSAVVNRGYEQPTEIQAEIIPHLLAGRDVLAQSQTGSGKTAAFALPILSQIETGRRTSRSPQVLVLAPTRELAVQVAESFSEYGAMLPGFRVTTIYGGASYDSQFRQLKRGTNVVVGTPGRVIDHLKRGTLDLSEIACLVLDEADEMLNMGFLEDVRFVLDHTPDDQQIALFSATLPKPIRAIAEEHLQDPACVTIKRKTLTADSIRQRALFIQPRNKIDALKRLLEAEDTDGVIVFTKTKDATVTVAEQLQQDGLATVALNGDMPQRVRERTIDQLKKGQLDVLVATDVAARGLDVSRISHVINYDAPNDSETYVHRIGRTGRAGRKGEAIIFLSRSQRGRLKQIERLTRQSIEIIDLPSADDINAARSRRFLKQIAETAAEQDLQVFEDLIERYAAESGTPMLKIAAALAHLNQQGRPFVAEELPPARHDRRDRSDGHRSGRDNGKFRPAADGKRPRRNESTSDAVEPGMNRYRIAVGWKDGVKPGNIVGAVANEGGIDGESIGAIRLYSSWSTIDLPEGMPDHVRESLQTTRVAGRPLQLRPYTEDARPPRKHSRQFEGTPKGKKSFSGGKRGPAGHRARKSPAGRKQKDSGRSAKSPRVRRGRK